MYELTSLSKFTYDIVITRTRHSMKTSRAWDMKKKWKTNSVQLHEKTQTPQLKRRSSQLKKMCQKNAEAIVKLNSALIAPQTGHRSYRISPSTSFPQDRLMTCGCSANLTSIYSLELYLLYYSSDDKLIISMISYIWAYSAGFSNDWWCCHRIYITWTVHFYH